MSIELRGGGGRRVSRVRRGRAARLLLGAWLGPLLLVAAARPVLAQDLADATLAISGARLTVSPESQTVPFDTPTQVLTQLVGFNPAQGSVPANMVVLGDLSGPQISGSLTLQTTPGQPFQIPRLQIQGLYALDNIRLMQGGSLLGYAQPRSVSLTVTQVLVTSVTSRALTTDEIRSYGIVVDSSSSFQAYNFTFAFAVQGGQTVNYNVPILFNQTSQSSPPLPLFMAPGSDNGGAHVNSTRFTPPTLAPFQLTFAGSGAGGSPGVSGGCADSEDDCGGGGPALPLPGVVLFPTDVSLLHQFFAVILMVQNGAPAGDPLVLRDLSATVTLPPGLKQASTQPPTPLGVPVPIRVPGPDGILGTADDITFLVAQAAGQAQVLTEGIEQGTQIVTFDIQGVVDGLPGGKLQTVSGRAQGAVVVRDPTLNVTVTFPQVVRAQEPYQLTLTVTNTGTSPANQLTLRLPPEKLAGAQLVGQSSQTVDVLPGDSTLVTFNLISLLTGRVIADAVRNSDEITPTFDLSMGVGENNIPLSPNAILLPDATTSLPADLVNADLLLIGLGYSLATAPPQLLTGGNLPEVTLGVVDQRVYELSQAGTEVTMGEALFDSAAILATLWGGAQDGDTSWDQLRRITQKGGAAGARLGAIFAAESAATSPQAAFNRFAATTAFVRRAQGGIEGALAVGAGATLQVASRASGARLAGGGDDPARLRELPFGDLYLLDSQGGAQMAILSVPETTGYQATLRIAGGGAAELDLLVPAADGSLRIVRWSGVTLSAAGTATVSWAAADTTFTLRIDADGSGAAVQSVAGSADTPAPRAFAVVAAMQNSAVDPTGHVVDVLFSGDVDRTSLLPTDSTHFLVAGKVSNGGLTQVDADIATQAEAAGPGNPAALTNSRVLRVVFNNPLSPYVTQPIGLTVARVKSISGESLAGSGGQVPVKITVTAPGEQVTGTVYGPDGKPVPFANVTLTESDVCILCGEDPCNAHHTAAVQADGSGRFLFDYVRSRDADGCGDSFGLGATDPGGSEGGTATGRVRLIGSTAQLDVLMLGRGTIRGHVSYDDGSLVTNPGLVAFSPVFRQWGSPSVDAYGNYTIANVPVGTVLVTASDAQGRFFVTTLAVPSAGSVVNQDLVILRLPAKPVPTGQLSGQVTRPDGVTPVFAAYVALYVDGSLIGVQRTDAAGGFDFGTVPAGQAEVDTYENVTGQSGDQVFFQIPPDQPTVIDLLMNDNRGAVQGHVYRQSGTTLTPLAGAVVWVSGTPFQTFTDSTGYYHLDGVFTGSWWVNAADLTNQVTTNAAVTIESENDTATRDLYFQAPQVLGGIAGVVLDTAGHPVPNATVHLAAGSLNWWDEVLTDVNGSFTLPGLAPGSYDVHAYAGVAGSHAGATIRFPGDTPFVTIQFRVGTIRGIVQSQDASGQTTGLKSVITYTTTVVREGLVGLALTPATMETNDDGTFEIDNVLAGLFNLTAYNPFYGSQSSSGTLVNQGEVQSRTFTFQANGPGTITGVVLDQDGVTPAAGAIVHLGHPDYGTYDLTADASGAFEFDLVPPTPYNFPITVTYQNGVIFRDAQILVNLNQPNQTLNVQVVLPKQGSIAGVVQDADHNPVPAAIVTLNEGQYPYRHLPINADANGAFQYSNIFAGSVSLTALAPTLGGLGGRINETISAEGQALTGIVIPLQPTGKITGTVLSPVDGSAVPNASVKVFKATNGALIDAINADAGGHFEFDLLPLMSYTTYAFDPLTGREGQSGWLTLNTNDQVVDGTVTLEARGEVSGHLYDPDPTPAIGIPNATVQLFSHSVTPFSTWSSSDLSGAFQFGGIPQGDFDLSAREPFGHRNAKASGTIATEGQQVALDLYLQKEGTVTGSALNPPGRQAGKFPNVNVTLTQFDTVIGGVLASDYQFGNIVAGEPFELDAQEVGGNHIGSARGTLADSTPIEVDIQMVPIGAVHVVVQDSFGHPVPGAGLQLSTNGPYGWHLFDASASAEAADALFENVGQGNFSVYAVDQVTRLSGSAYGAIATDGQIAEVVVHLQNAGSVQGHVLLADGVTPAVGAEAVLYVDNFGQLLAQTDGNGDFLFSSVPLTGFDLQLQQNLGPGTLEVAGQLGSNGQVVDLGNLVLDATDLQVVSITPADGSAGVALNQVVTVTFNKPIDPSRMPLGGGTSVTIPSGHAAPASTSYSADATQILFTPSPSLDNATTYLVTVPAGVYSVSGKQLRQAVRTSFTTVDHLAPAVIAVTPAAAAVQVALAVQPQLTFNKPIDPTSLSGNHLQLTDVTTGGGITTTFMVSPTGRVLTVTPQAALTQEHQYQITVQGVVDLVGNVQAAPFVSTFTALDTTAPRFGTLAPAAGAVFSAGDAVDIAVAVTDLSGVHDVDIQLGSRSADLTAAGAGGVYSVSWKAPPVAAPTDVPITITATDAWGNVGTLSSTIHVLPVAAGGPPALALACPSSGALLAPGTSLNVTATAGETSGIQRVELWVGSGGTLPAAATFVDYDAPYSFVVAAPAGATDGQVIPLRLIAVSFGNTTAEVDASFTVVTGQMFQGNAAIAAGDTRYDGGSVIVTGGKLTIDGPHTFRDLVVLDGATVQHSQTTATQEYHLTLALTRGLYVACGGAIDVSDLGYIGGAWGGDHALRGNGYGNSPDEGASPTGAGGSYGGRGGTFDGSSPVYGSIWNPRDPGAGGGFVSGSPGTSDQGGGVVTIQAAAAGLVDGAVRANGGNSAFGSGGGAGGSVLLRAATLGGAGTIHADGGAPYGQTAGGGSGGRIALFGATVDAGLVARSSAVGAANPGAGAAAAGAAGTVYWQLDGHAAGNLMIDNHGVTSSQYSELVSVGAGTLTATDGTATVTDALADFHHDLAGIGLAVAGGSDSPPGAALPIAANAHHGQTLTLQNGSATALPPVMAVGAPYSGQYTFETVTVGAGVQAIAVDAVSTTAAAPAVGSNASWTVGYTAALQFTSPAAGAEVTAGSPLTLAATATNLLGVSKVVLTLGSRSTTLTAPPYTWTLNAPPVAAPTGFTATAVAYTSSGPHTVAQVGIVVNPAVDPQAPVVTPLCPRTGALVEAGAPLPITFTVADALQVSTYSLSVDGVVQQTLVGGPAVVSGSLTWTPPAGTAAGTTFNLEIAATNPAGHVGYADLQVVVAGGALSGAVTLGSSYSGQALILGAGTYTVPAPLALAALTVLNGARVMGAAGSGEPGLAGAPLALNVTGTVAVECGGTIDASGLGYLGGVGMNATGQAPAGVSVSLVWTGGSHGGLGLGTSDWAGPAGAVFDSVYLPQLGGGGASNLTASEGARGGNGGGVVSLTAALLQLDGQIVARGEATGGLVKATGGGGTVVVHAQTLAGAGSIDVSGGTSTDGFGIGVGGGGRVAIYAATLAGFDPLHQVTAGGGSEIVNGSPWGYGGPGTVYWKDGTATYGRLLLASGQDGSGNDRVGPATPLPPLGAGAASAWTAANGGADAWLSGPAAFGTVWLGAWVAVSDAAGNLLGEFEVTQIDGSGRALLGGAGAVSGAARYQGEYRFDRIDIASSGGLAASDPVKSGDVEVAGSAARLPVGQLSAGSLTLAPGTVLGPAAGSTMSLAVSGALTIPAGARIDATALGYLGSVAFMGPGLAPASVGASQYDAGGSHGGSGLATSPSRGPAGDAYDSVFLPQLGGGGGSIGSITFGARGGNGGGAVALTAGTLQLDGQIVAAGESGYGPSLARSGGAGGAVEVHAGSVAGAGIIDVTGGGMDGAGTGGGGRVAIYTTAALSGFDPAAQVHAAGGVAKQSGTVTGNAGAGTVFWKDGAATYGKLRIDAGGASLALPLGATPLPAIGKGIVGTATPDGADPTSLWITAQAGTPLFGLGVTGLWVSAGGGEYAVIGQSADRTQILLAGAAGAVAAGDSFYGIYRLDQLVVTGNAKVTASDAVDAPAIEVDSGASLTYPDLLPPVISNVQPAAGTQVTAGAAITFSATVADAHLVSVVMSFGERSTTLTAGAAPFTWTTVASPVGAPTDVPFTITATDANGNVGTFSELIHVLPATAAGAPAVALVCPSSGALLAPGTSLTLTATASEASGIDKVELFLGSGTTPLATAYNAPYTFVFTAPAGSADGDTLHVRVRATSAGGTTAEAAADLTVVSGNVLSGTPAIAAGNTQYDGTSLIVAGGTATIDGPHTFRDLVVLDGATVVHSPTSAAQENHLVANLTRHLYVACGGAIDVSGRGYLGGASAAAHAYGYGNTPAEGAGPAGAGGSYGGRGGRFDGSSPVYGSFWNPQDPGAGGGWAAGTPVAANGGGVVVVGAGGNVLVDGVVRANGGQATTGGSGGSGGGAGGSVLLIAAGSLGGAGSVQALGGAPTATPSPALTGGGSGGRVALFGASIDSGLLGRASAAGAAGTSSDPSTWGAAGTVFAKLNGNDAGDLILDNGGVASSQYTELLSVGSGVVGSAGSATMTDPLADFRHDLSGIDVLFGGGGGSSSLLFPIAANTHHGQTLTLTVAQPPLSAQVTAGTAYSGVYLLRNFIVRGGAQAIAADAVEAENGVQVASGSSWTPSYSPAVTITAPAAGAQVTAGNSLTASATVSSLLGISKVVFGLDGQSVTATAPPWSATLVAPQVSASTSYPLTATAYAPGGTHATASVPVTINPGVDVLAPVIKLACAMDGGLVMAGAATPISFTATDANQVSSYSLLVNGAVVQTATPNLATVSATLSWTPPAGTPAGTSFSLEITATNPGGHVGFLAFHMVVAGSGTLAGTVTLGSSYGGQSLVLGPGTYTVPAPLSLASLTVLGGAQVTGTASQPLNLTVSGALTVQCGGRIDASAQGYAGSPSAGSGVAPAGVTVPTADAGGSHGGVGNLNTRSNATLGTVYDSVYMPQLGGGSGSVYCGGGGTHGGNGGGLVTLTVGTLQLDGAIWARGETRPPNGGTAGGAGGSIVVSAATVAGSGTIDASGGSGDNGGNCSAGGTGGGGRVALYATTFSGFDPTAQVLAQGAQQNTNSTPVAGLFAGPGTVFWKDGSATYGRLLIDSGHDSSGKDRKGPLTPLPALGSGAVTAWASAGGGGSWLTAATHFGASWLGAWVNVLDSGGNGLGLFAVTQIDGQGRALLAGASSVSGTPVTYQGEYRFDRIDLKSSAGMTASDPVVSGDVEVYGTATQLPAQMTTTNMTVNAGSVATAAVGGSVNLTVSGTLHVASGARIDVSAQGYAGSPSAGPGVAPAGVTVPTADAGGSHGGAGNYTRSSVTVGAVYDSVYLPQLPGGSGSVYCGGGGTHGGNGGGVVMLTVGTLQLDGAIWARGETRAPNGGTAGGAGGSIVVNAATVAGAGAIDASGGSGDDGGNCSAGGPGGGGRVALYATTLSGFDPTAQVLVQGAQQNNNGTPVAGLFAGPGTVFWKDGSATYGRLLIDSGHDGSGKDRKGPLTPLPALGSGAVTAWAAAGGGSGGGMWLTAAAHFGSSWLGAWVNLLDAGGNGLGLFEVTQIDGQGRALLSGASGVTGTPATYQGEYRFDRVDLKSSAGMTATDPVVSGDVEVYGTATQLPAQMTTTNMTVNAGSVATAAVGGSLNLTVSGTLHVASGARIDVSALGYAGSPSAGPGVAPAGVTVPTADAGGSHGGAGNYTRSSVTVGAVYDSVYLPQLPGGSGSVYCGGGGTHGGNGGGVLTLAVGTLQLDGAIWARGETRPPNGGTAGGAGGSIVVNAGTVAGAGTIDASGGSGDDGGNCSAGGPGGGGRVALYATTFSGFDPTAQVLVQGAQQNNNATPVAGLFAGPGTAFWKDGSATYGRLLIDSGQDGTGKDRKGPLTPLPALGSGAVTAWAVAGGGSGGGMWLTAAAPFGAPWLGAWVNLFDAGGDALGLFEVTQIDTQGRALLAGASGVTGTPAGYQGEYRFDRIDLKSSAGMTASDPVVSGDVEVYGTATQLPAQITTTNMTVNAGAVATAAVGGSLNLTVSGTLHVASGARIDVSAQGYPGSPSAGSGLAPAGVTVPTTDAGGSHGGVGNLNTRSNVTLGAVYDSVYLPQLAGGSGSVFCGGGGTHGGNGGGVVTLAVGTLQLDGAIWARGETRPPNGGTAGGAGGSVMVSAAAVAGAGTIDASGGSGDNGGNCGAGGTGGGGRVALVVTTFEGFDPSEQVLARGAQQQTNGSLVAGKFAGSGTVYWKTSSSTYGDLRVDSGQGTAFNGSSVPITALPSVGVGTVGTVTPDATVAANAWITATSGAAFQLGLVGMWVRDGGIDYQVVGQSSDLKKLDLAGAAGLVAVGDSFRGVYKFDEVDVRGGCRLQFNDTNVVGTWGIDPNSSVIQNVP